jgi:hypothetical protein
VATGRDGVGATFSIRLPYKPLNNTEETPPPAASAEVIPISQGAQRSAD